MAIADDAMRPRVAAERAAKFEAFMVFFVWGELSDGRADKSTTSEVRPNLLEIRNISQLTPTPLREVD